MSLVTKPQRKQPQTEASLYRKCPISVSSKAALSASDSPMGSACGGGGLAVCPTGCLGVAGCVQSFMGSMLHKMMSGQYPKIMTVGVTCELRCQCLHQQRKQVLLATEVRARAHLSLLTQVTSLSQFFMVLESHPSGPSGFFGPVSHTGL